MSSSAIFDTPLAGSPPWRFNWLTPARCRLILAILLALGFLSHLGYLHLNSPIDLAGDEAQYWDWSRNLDWSYYSKGPLVAYLIRASCAIFGDTMPAVRYPALALGVGTSIVAYLLTLKLFGSERLALGAVLLFHFVPMFIAGSVLMTVDPPMFFCWALATYFAAIAVFDEKRWAWIGVGIAVGIGFLAKYVEFTWFIGLFGFLLFHDRRRNLKGAIASLLIAALFTIPVIVWNMQHDWVSFRHVAKQTGASTGTFSIMNVLVMIASQIGIFGPTLAWITAGAVFYAISSKRSGQDPNRSKLIFLSWFGVSYLLLNLLVSVRTKVQPNWPAPAYFTLMILAAYFLGTRLTSLQTWKPWRGWFYGTIGIGMLAMIFAHDTSMLFPILRPFYTDDSKLARFDALSRLRGWEEIGQFVSDQLKEMPPGTFVFCNDYQHTAEMAFYVDGRPKTYCAASYLGRRLSQYDMWPDRRMDPASPLVGRDAIYFTQNSSTPQQLDDAFERVERIKVYGVEARGVTVRRYYIWQCYRFKGLTMPGETEY